MGFSSVAGAPASTATKLAEISLAAPGTTLDSGAFGTGYKIIRFYLSMPSAFSGVPTDCYALFNNTAGGKYYYLQMRMQNASIAGARGAAANNIPCLQWDSGTAGTMGVVGQVTNASSADPKFFDITFIGDEISDANWRSCNLTGCFNETTAEITSVKIVASTNFPTGSTLLVIGEK